MPALSPLQVASSWTSPLAELDIVAWNVAQEFPLVTVTVEGKLENWEGVVVLRFTTWLPDTIWSSPTSNVTVWDGTGSPDGHTLWM